MKANRASDLHGRVEDVFFAEDMAISGHWRIHDDAYVEAIRDAIKLKPLAMISNIAPKADGQVSRHRSHRG